MNYCEKELIALKSKMAEKQLDPSNDIIADGETHEYTKRSNGISRLATYTVVPNPFDDTRKGPRLIAWFGFIDEEIYYYSSLAT